MRQGPRTVGARILDSLPDRLNSVFRLSLVRTECGNESEEAKWRSLYDSAIFSSRDLTDAKRAFLLSSIHSGEQISLRLSLENVSGFDLNVFSVRLSLNGSPKGSLTLYPSASVHSCTRIESPQIGDGAVADIRGSDLTYPKAICDRHKLLVDVLRYAMDLKALTYSLVVTVKTGCITNPGEQRLFKAHFDWRTISPLSIDITKHNLLRSSKHTKTKAKHPDDDSLDSEDEEEVYRLYLETVLTNATCEPQMDISVDRVSLQCMGLFAAKCITHRTLQSADLKKLAIIESSQSAHIRTAVKSMRRPIPFVLRHGAAEQLLFEVTLAKPLSVVNLHSLSIGVFDILWSAQSAQLRDSRLKKETSAAALLYRNGIFKSELIKRSSPLCRKIASSCTPHAVDAMGSSGSSSVGSLSPRSGGRLALSSDLRKSAKKSVRKSASASAAPSMLTPNIEVLITKVPAKVELHSVFDCELRLMNNDRYRYKVWLTLDKHVSGKLLPCGNSRKCVGILEPHSTTNASLQLFAYAAGMYSIHGLLVTAQRVIVDPTMASASLRSPTTSTSTTTATGTVPRPVSSKVSFEQCLDVTLRFMAAARQRVIPIQRHSDVYGTAAAALMSLSTLRGAGDGGCLSPSTLRRLLPFSDGRVTAQSLAALYGAVPTKTSAPSPATYYSGYKYHCDATWNIHFDAANTILVKCPKSMFATAVGRLSDAHVEADAELSATPVEVESSGSSAPIVVEHSSERAEVSHTLTDEESRDIIIESESKSVEIGDELLPLEAAERVESVALLPRAKQVSVKLLGAPFGEELTARDSMRFYDAPALDMTPPNDDSEGVDEAIDTREELLEAKRVVDQLRKTSTDGVDDNVDIEVTLPDTLV